MRTLVNKKAGKLYSKSFKLISTSDFKVNKLSLDILNLLGTEPMYPNQIAKRLKMHEQKIYYHINRLLKAGFIELDREEGKHGAICRFFKPAAQSFGIELAGGERKSKQDDPHVQDFLKEFVSTGVFNGSIIVGSPLQHGPYLTSSRDGHYSVQLGVFLGNFCSLENRFVVKLDTEAKKEKSLNRNLILIGGPVTNMLCNDVNDNLDVQFKWNNGWSLYSKKTKKQYTDEPIGLIAKIKNPYDKTKSIILLSGVQFDGTKACIIALTGYPKKVFKNYKPGKDFYCVVKGLDKDGDGKIDDIEVLE